ncbi:hypothetical protein PRIPAC_95415 [Pristionchus pacificus]|uniref:Uncharacterized protein n=1 Tax=Pristionchus pacificus TaxID=54126 RepID=A0A454Y3Y2_PRIPA|nr:hypothetical protein PRIPAC_95415 [Pristionchus pacificus]|eukprot:PDM66115.1 hypothetical protein PRIPAC_45340 [Pristionchus pacificus]
MASTSEKKVEGIFIKGVFCPVTTAPPVEKLKQLYEDGLRRGMNLGAINEVVERLVHGPHPPYDLTPFLIDVASKMNKEQADQWINALAADPRPETFACWMVSVLPYDRSTLIAIGADPNLMKKSAAAPKSSRTGPGAPPSK